jgi:hypothetical protein
MVTVIKKKTSVKQIRRALKKMQGAKGNNAYKHCGVIKLKEKPLAIQKKLRNEWE